MQLARLRLYPVWAAHLHDPIIWISPDDALTIAHMLSTLSYETPDLRSFAERHSEILESLGAIDTVKEARIDEIRI